MLEKVKAINKLLTDQGAIAVQKKPSIGSRPALYGYRPMCVFDAVNEVLGPLGWNHTIDNIEYSERQAIVRVSVSIEGRHSYQFGEAQIVKGDKGSAAKGAVTDALQKALSLFGIGAAAYRGELETVYNAKQSYTVKSDESSLGYRHTISLFEVARKITDKETGRTFWRENLKNIDLLTNDERTELVKILENK